MRKTMETQSSSLSISVIEASENQNGDFPRGNWNKLIEKKSTKSVVE